MGNRLILSGALAVCAASVIAAGQGQVPRFRAAIDLVHLDVSVLDNERRPVRGLTAQDFQILEDGKPQDITTFSAIDIPDVAEPSTPWMREVPPDTRRNDTLSDRRLFVIVMDDATVQNSLFALNSARKIARRFIEQLGPTDLAAVVFTRDSRNAQDFTSDRKRLLATVDKFSLGFRDLDGVSGVGQPIPSDDFLYFRYTVETLLKVSELLSALPEQRKALVYIGQGVPLDVAAASEVVMAQQLRGTVNSGRQALLLQRMREAFRKADRANVTFYTLDICGLRAAEFPKPCAHGPEVDFLRGIAEETGGYSTADTNDFEPGIQQIFRENASYYLIGFRSANPNADGKYRRIEVRVRRPGLRVRTRSGYTSDKEDDRVERESFAETQPLTVAVSGLLPKRDVPLQAWAAPFAIAGKSESSVPVVLAFRHEVEARDVRATETVDVRVDANTIDGKRKAFQSVRSQLVLRPGPEGQVAYEVHTMLPLPPGRYQLRMAASLLRLRKSGSVYFDIEVPDVTKGALTWSGVAFNASPGVTTAASPKLQTGIPIAPTSQRLFARTDAVSAFARIHQGGKSPLVPLPMTATVTDSNGRQVWKRTETLDPSRFTTARGADVLIALPIAQLEPGAYRLRFEAVNGVLNVSRDSRFTVR